MKRIRVLVADDSFAMRAALTTLLAADSAIEVVGQAKDGREAVALAAELHPDVITMDVLMPNLDGLAATRAIMEASPSRVLIVSSASDAGQTSLSFRALAAGALEVIEKPSPTSGESPRAFATRVSEAIRLMAEVPVVRRFKKSTVPTRAVVIPPPAPPPAAVDAIPRTTKERALGAIGIVASTGGPPALAKILGALPATLPVPILIAQHVTPGFTGGLVRWLADESRLSVSIAKKGEAARPACVYLPPDGEDLLVDDEGVLQTTRAERVLSSGDRLLSSIAASYHHRGAGLVLTGMGEDGARGLLAIRRAGGWTVAQDEASSVVHGMPKAAIDIGAAEEVLSLSRIATAIVARTLRNSRSSRPPWGSGETS